MRLLCTYRDLKNQQQYNTCVAPPTPGFRANGVLLEFISSPYLYLVFWVYILLYLFLLFLYLASFRALGDDTRMPLTPATIYRTAPYIHTYMHTYIYTKPIQSAFFSTCVCPPAMLRAPVMTPLHSGKSGMSCATSIGPAQYMREEMLTPSPPPNWGQHFAAPPDRTGEMEFKDEVNFSAACLRNSVGGGGGVCFVLLSLCCVPMMARIALRRWIGSRVQQGLF